MSEVIGVYLIPQEGGPRPGRFMVGANELHSYDSDWSYFLELQPVAVIGATIFVYDIDVTMANMLRKKLDLPLLVTTD